MHTINDSQDIPYFMDALGIKWYLLLSQADFPDAPQGYNRVPMIDIIAGKPDLSPEQIRALVAQNLGAYWYLGGEPNRGIISGSAYADRFHYYQEEIKGADPTAKIISASILNFDFTCVGCGGFQKGRLWVNDFRTAYKNNYGQEPPVDVWGMDVYPIDWYNTPNAHHQIAIDQMTAYREYLNEIPEHRDKPIWIMEISMHWGYDGWTRVPGSTALQPTGEYREECVAHYLSEVLTWLDANAESYNIGRWFWYITYRPIHEANCCYTGIIFFENGDVGAPLNRMGEMYRQHAAGNVTYTRPDPHSDPNSQCPLP